VWPFGLIGSTAAVGMVDSARLCLRLYDPYRLAQGLYSDPHIKAWNCLLRIPMLPPSKMAYRAASLRSRGKPLASPYDVLQED
jgi:hypothetical protein